MRDSTVEADSILAGSFTHRWLADLHYNEERLLSDIPIRGLTLREDASGAIEASGSCQIVWTDDYGRSMSPQQITDAFAPFGAELALYSVVSAGAASARIPMGFFPLFGVPDSRDEVQLFAGRSITTGSVIDVTFKDRFLYVQRDRFDVPGVPPALTSVYDELARLTGLQITRTVDDEPITRSVVYEEDRLKAVYDLAALLDSTPCMTPDGTLSLRPKTAGAVVDVLVRGEGGRILNVGRSLSSDKVYNRVAFRGKSGDQDAILAVAEVTSGPLRVRNADGSRSPFGTVTKFMASEYVVTTAQAQAAVDAELVRSSRLGAVVVPVTTVFNPLYELGDVLDLQRADKVLTGRVVSISRSSAASMTMDVEVTDA